VRPADPDRVSDEEWMAYLFLRRNRRGSHVERWRHTHGCGRFFNAVRDTVGDRFLATYEMGRPPPDEDATTGSDR
jgi:sarcosine oxidase subunit delta